MAAAQETTFSIFVIAFPGKGAEVIPALSNTFGIANDVASSILERAPVRVKKGVGPADAKLLAKQLLSVGANLAIFNEQTGEEKRYPTPPAPPPAARALGLQGTLVMPSLPPQVGYAPPGAEGLFGPPPSGAPPERTSGIPSQPPSADHHIVKCKACARFIEQGSDRCNHCGWDSNGKKRHCRSCGKDIALAAGLSPILWGAILAAGVGAGAAAFLFFGPLAGGASLFLVISLGLVVDGARVHYRCTQCKRSVDAAWLQPVEKKPLLRARLKWIAYGVAFAVMSAGVAAPAAQSRETTLFIDSFGIGYRSKLPFTHTEFVRAEHNVSTPIGLARVITVASTLRKQPVSTYEMMQLVRPRLGPAKLDAAETDQIIAAAIKKLIPDAELAQGTEVNAAGTSGRELAFKGTIDGRAALGKVRGFEFVDYELVMVLYIASTEEAAAGPRPAAFLASLNPERAR